MDITSTPPVRDFQDRSRWLVLVGLAEILIGGLCGLLGLLFPILSSFLLQSAEPSAFTGAEMTVLTVGSLLALALLFVLLGVGTMRARRWARDLMLVAAWIWLGAGILTFLLLFLVGPHELSEMRLAGQQGLSPGETAAFMIIYAVFVGFVYVIVPGAFVLFYSGRNVKKTFETRDPVARWTSKCPLPVFTACQFWAGGAVTLLLASYYSDGIRVFGGVIDGIAARLILVLAALISGYLAWALYKLKPYSWWLSLGFSILGLTWFAGSYSAPDAAKLFAGADISLHLDERTLSGIFIILGLAWLVFLVIIRRHFAWSTKPDKGMQHSKEQQ